MTHNLTRRRLLRSVAAVSAAGLVAGRAPPASAQSGADWPQAQFDSANTNHNPAATAPRTPPALTTVVDRPEALGEHLVFAGDRLYLGGPDLIAAHNLSDGSELWTWNATEISGQGNPVAIAGGQLYAAVGRFDSSFLTLVPDSGSVNWQVSSSGVSTLSVADDQVYASRRRTLDALDSANTPRWSKEFEGAITGSAVANGTVFLSAGGTVVALDPGDASELWRQSVGAIGAPAVASGRVVTVGEQVSAIDAAEGTTLWQSEELPAPVTTPVAVTPQVVYVGAGREATENTFFALDAETGEINWGVELGATTTASAIPAAARPATTGSTVYVTSEDDTVHAIDADSGDILWRESLDAGLGAPVPASGRLFVSTTDGRVLAFEEQTDTGDDPDDDTDDDGSEDSTDGDTEDDEDPEAGTEDGDDSGPGFGVPAALTALGGAGYLLRRTRADEE